MKHENQPTSVLHVETEQEHAVLISSLRVVVVKDGSQWFAQGLELDYAAAGDSKEDVKSRFQDGLASTVQEHLKMYGSVERILKVAPQEAWDLWLDQGDNYTFSQASLHFAEQSEFAFPFSGIAYLESQEALAA